METAEAVNDVFLLPSAAPDLRPSSVVGVAAAAAAAASSSAWSLARASVLGRVSIVVIIRSTWPVMWRKTSESSRVASICVEYVIVWITRKGSHGIDDMWCARAAARRRGR